MATVPPSAAPKTSNAVLKYIPFPHHCGIKQPAAPSPQDRAHLLGGLKIQAVEAELNLCLRK
jgi:hypothetical protein